MFLVIYNEHGGFYDHVPMPTGVPSPNDIVGPEPYNFKFDRFGCRVLAIIVSPLIECGTGLRSLKLEKQTWLEEVEGRSLEETPTWDVAIMCFVLVLILIIIEHMIL